MSSGCGDVLSLADLQTAKKHQLFEAEVITGKQGGVAGGADIDFATNTATGQTQKTLPAVLRDAGFFPASFDFTTGGTLSVASRNQVVYDPVSLTWYSWAGALPKVVPAGTNPLLDSNWKPQTDPKLRDDLDNGMYRTDATAISFVPGVVIDNTTNNRTAIYAFSGKIYVPTGMQFRCNFLPDDDVTKFIGEGTILTQDPWGNEHVFSVSLATNGSKYTASNVLNQHARLNTQCRVGIVGDSITDGAYGNGWVANPTDGSGNLSSVNYDHNGNGGAGSWFRTFTDWLNRFTKNGAFIFKAENCASSGKRLIDGWANRNFDYGFFMNTAYGNVPPDVCFMSMGVNDNGQIDTLGFDEYLFRFEQFIRKAWGYGCAVSVISLNQNGENWAATEAAIKKRLERLEMKVEFLDLAKAVTAMYRDTGSYTLAEIAKRPTDGTFDFTHFAPLGHQFIGAYAAKEMMPYRVQSVGATGNFAPTCPNDVQPIGFPSGSTYSVGMEVLSGNTYLDGLSGWGVASPASENITIRYFVWCDSADVSLTVFEPYGPTYTTGGRTNSISIRQQDQRNTAYYSGALASTSVSSFTNKLTTGVGLLKKGLNQIEIVYDGAPSKVYLPGLLFRKDMNECATLRASVFLSAGAIKGVYGQVRDRSDLLLKYNVETANDEAPDMYSNTKSNNVQTVSLQSLPLDCGVVFYYKASSKSGVVARRVATGIEISTMLFGAFTSVGTLVCDVTGAVTIMASLAASVPTISVTPTTGGTVTQAVAGYSGGKIALINRGASSATVSVSSSAQHVL